MFDLSRLLIPVLAGAAAILAVYAIASLFRRRNVVTRRLEELDSGGQLSRRTVLDRQALRREAISRLRRVGEGLRRRGDSGRLQDELTRAGFRGSGAPAVYTASRMLAALVGGFIAFVAIPFLDPRWGVVAMGAFYFMGLGWYVPRFWLRFRITRRQAEIRRALPDLADLLVVCTEAGLGLSQAMGRITEEMVHLCPPLAEEMAMVTLEVRANTPREEALRNLAERTGVGDLRSFASMLIQATRFGTSITQALRVYSESLRLKRRQRAEEAAAKTTVKLVLPLVFFIFPSLFVILLGPAGILMMDQFVAPPRP